ncbi:MAG: serine dehydratase, partial [Ruminococcaceae bacterium]|nr:serine dehydratase [Oscillospiraceae bacterium]
IGGGSIEIEGEGKAKCEPDVYPHSTFAEIAEVCRKENIRLYEYVIKYEGEDIYSYLDEVWDTMKNSIHEGLSTTGILPGGLGTKRKARILFEKNHIDESMQTRENRLVSAYAFAVSEQNAAGGTIATAPTCGSCGVLPSVLKYMQESRGFSDRQIFNALATAALIGNIIRTNASISGAECGCQAEIGSACSMAAAALGELFGMGLDQIEYAAEVAMEHHLGLTCDPICGLVQIPCIERNAVAAMRAINALSLANFLSDSRKITFDLIVKTMYNTGCDLPLGYRETSVGGLAKYYPVQTGLDID